MTEPVTSTGAELEVRQLQPAIWPQVVDTYAAGIAAGNATFETAPPSWEDWKARRPTRSPLRCHQQLQPGGLDRRKRRR
jgi:L-amino acid N-acyltransferase YncA